MIAEVCRRVESSSQSPSRENQSVTTAPSEIASVDLSSIAAEPKGGNNHHQQPRKCSSSTATDKPSQTGQRKGFGINLKSNGAGDDQRYNHNSTGSLFSRKDSHHSSGNHQQNQSDPTSAWAKGTARQPEPSTTKKNQKQASS